MRDLACLPACLVWCCGWVQVRGWTRSANKIDVSFLNKRKVRGAVAPAAARVLGSSSRPQPLNLTLVCVCVCVCACGPQGGPGSGTYILYVRAVDPAGNRDHMFVEGRNMHTW